jgi:hypothetical protein
VHCALVSGASLRLAVAIGVAFLNIEGCELPQCETAVVRVSDAARAIFDRAPGGGVCIDGKAVGAIEGLGDASARVTACAISDAKAASIDAIAIR